MGCLSLLAGVARAQSVDPAEPEPPRSAFVAWDEIDDEPVPLPPQLVEPVTPPEGASVRLLANEARERLGDLKCALPGRFLGSINDPGAEVCVNTAGLNVCVLARRSIDRELSYYLSFTGHRDGGRCDG